MVHLGLRLRVSRVSLVCLLCALLFSWRSSEAAPDRNVLSEPSPSEPITTAKVTFWGMADEIAAHFRKIINREMEAQGFSVRSQEDVQRLLGDEIRLVSCKTAACQGRLAQLLGVRRAVEGEVQRLELSTFSIRLYVRDLFSGETTEPLSELCQVCSTDDVERAVERLAKKLAKRVTPRSSLQVQPSLSESGILVVETEPAGAAVTIDGERRSERTPASFLLRAGVHELLVEDDKQHRVTQHVEVSPGTQPVTVRLRMDAQVARRTWKTVLGIVGIAGAAGLVAGGSTLLYFDGKPAFSDGCVDQGIAGQRCPNQYTTVLPGSLMIVGAGLLAIGGGVLLYLDNRPAKAKPVPASLVLKGKTRDPVSQHTLSPLVSAD